MQRRGGYIAVEGPIGVGKTSLARALSRQMSARLVLEEVDGNPFLSRFYEDPDKFALPVQLYFLLTRYNQQRELAQQDLFAQATVSDYLFAKDRIFASLNLAPDEMTLYDNVYRLLDARMAKPDLVVYIRANVEVLAARLRKRNRDFAKSRLRTAYQPRLPRAGVGGLSRFFLLLRRNAAAGGRYLGTRFRHEFRRPQGPDSGDRARSARSTAFRAAQALAQRGAAGLRASGHGTCPL